MIEHLSSRHVVLLGIGHTNAHILRMWRMNPIPDTDLTCISNHLRATYSGVMPAVLAGQVPREEMEIDLVRLCDSVGARLLTDRVTGIDHPKQRILFDDRPPVPFDELSIGIGSTANCDDVLIEGDSFVGIKPMQTFLDRLNEAVKRGLKQCGNRELRVIVVGGGVAGVEITACIPSFIRKVTDKAFSLGIVTRSNQILSDSSASTRKKIEREFHHRGVSILTNSQVSRLTESAIELSDGTSKDADLVVWTTDASAPPLLGHLGLELDDRGFIATSDTLQSISAKHLFAVGDTGTIVGQSLPKAGVYAVRQGPILWENIQRSLAGLPLQRYRPQRSFLRLINLGNGRAVGQWKGMSFEGRWVMRLKNRIDLGFMKMFQVEPMDSDEAAMQCHGCGCKLGTESLDAGLQSIDLEGPEDAAIIGGKGSRLVASTDFFSSPVDDPYLAGRISAIHAASDVIASGAKPTEALANVVLPEGDTQSQQQTLSDFMAGAKREFDSVGAAIVGGHTIVGPRMEVGFTVIGETIGNQLIRKGNLKRGDRLFLTKPLGIGILLAAQMRNRCAAAWYQQMIDSMLEPQKEFASIAVQLGITAGTDVTGFGFAGHLIEMLEGSGVAAEIWLSKVPMLPGVDELIRSGIQSSLAPENRRVEGKIDCSALLQEKSEYRVLFDPQTCGGLLFGVSEDRVERLQQSVAGNSLTEIGQVTDIDASPALLCVKI